MLTAYGPDERQGRGQANVPVDLTGNGELAWRWFELAGAIAEDERLSMAFAEISGRRSPDAVAHVEVDVARKREGVHTEWTLRLDVHGAALVARSGRLLTNPTGLGRVFNVGGVEVWDGSTA